MNIKKILKITLIVLVSIVVLFIVVHTVLTHILDDTLYGVIVGDSTRCGAYITEEHIFKDKLGGSLLYEM